MLFILKCNIWFVDQLDNQYPFAVVFFFFLFCYFHYLKSAQVHCQLSATLIDYIVNDIADPRKDDAVYIMACLFIHEELTSEVILRLLPSIPTV